MHKSCAHLHARCARAHTLAHTHMQAIKHANAVRSMHMPVHVHVHAPKCVCVHASGCMSGYAPRMYATECVHMYVA